MWLDRAFNGFPREMQEFLSVLPFENTPARQEENLRRYKKLVTEPLIKLYEALLPAVLGIGAEFDTKASRCISSPYTDRRFSPGKPLKEYMYIRFKQLGKTEDIAGLYFDMGADYYSYGLRIYQQTSQGMMRLRDKIAEAPDRGLDQLHRIAANGFSVFGDKYKKDHYPCLPDSLVKDLLNHKTFYIGKDVPVGEKVFTGELAGEIADGFWKMKDFSKLIME